MSTFLQLWWQKHPFRSVCAGVQLNLIAEPFVAAAVSERFHQQTVHDANRSGRELYHQRQHRVDTALEQPAESSQRHHSTLTSPYMLQHPFGSADNYCA